MLPIQKITGLLLAAVAAAKKTPSGSYSGNGTAGSKSFETAWYANMDGTTFDVSFRGGLSVECSQSPTGKGEAYALDDSGTLTLPNIQKEGAAAASPPLFLFPRRRRAGDCVHDELEKQDASVFGMTYNNETDVFQLELTVAGLMTSLQLAR